MGALRGGQGADLDTDQFFLALRTGPVHLPGCASDVFGKTDRSWSHGAF